ncbi:peptidylprolyl isomerase [Salinisphaera sp. LB1]|uniref:FKBP-type peptidyl-prolyl cis-trans isomerase n=1 Tax=Salinisphaera sp. LB1 TaxID=2183911 RepID=UPI000D7077C0|nr:peptidylprolyl isomerase [Salinisphaera sp. LB1]AWN16280.1 FKBP-type peptidyl-prolyl cis-trans isomerase SlyD [Salinisphaera sp. LB1]
MQAQRDNVVSIHYVLRDTEGEIIDQSGEGQPLAYLHGHENIVPGLEKAIEGCAEGEEVRATVEPEEGYGPYRDELVQKVNREAFQGVDELAPGMSFRAESDAGPMIVTIKDVDGDEVTVDGNHVLAGQTLDFTVNVAEIRPATDTELEHGHVHDENHAHE